MTSSSSSPTPTTLTVPQSRPKLRRPSTAPNLTNSHPRQLTHEALSLSPGPSFSHLVCPGAPRRPFLTLELELDDAPLSFDSPPSYQYQGDEDEDEDGDAQISVYEFIGRSPCSPPYQPYDSQDELPFEFDFDLDLNEESNQEQSSFPTPMTLDGQALGLQLDLGIDQALGRQLDLGIKRHHNSLSLLGLPAGVTIHTEASAWWSTTPELSISPTETEAEPGSPFFSSLATPPRVVPSHKLVPTMSRSPSSASPKRPETVDDDMPWHDLPSPSRSTFTPPGKSTPHTAEPNILREAISLAAFLAETPDVPSTVSSPSGGRVRRASEGDCLVRQDQQQIEAERERGRIPKVGSVFSRAKAALRRVR